MKTLISILIVLLGAGCGEFKKGYEKGVERQKKAAQERAKASNPGPPKATPEKLINDPIIEKAIRKELYKPTGVLTKAHLKILYGLRLENNQLTELPSKDLEKLTHIKSLDLSGNQLTNVNGLEKFTQLRRLSLNGNQLTDVKGLEKLTQLEDLKLDGNQLTDVKGLENLDQLHFLSLNGNQLTDVKGLEKLTKLKVLSLRRNQLTDLQGLKRLTKLQLLGLEGNPGLTRAQIDELDGALPLWTFIPSDEK
tara:strand:- start:1208 stop:1960 length:753 start_codon:yes stop_codon:yes gene_type:complete